MKEGAFQRWVVDTAKACGWRVWHVPAPMRWGASDKHFVPAKEAAGLPDLFMLHDNPPRLVIAEVKGDGGKLSDAQREFLGMARGVADTMRTEDVSHWDRGGKRAMGVYVFTPGMEDAITQMLKSKVLS